MKGLDSDMTSEMDEDGARSGRPSEMGFEDLKKSFSQYLMSRNNHVTIRSGKRWVEARKVEVLRILNKIIALS